MPRRLEPRKHGPNIGPYIPFIIGILLVLILFGLFVSLSINENESDKLVVKNSSDPISNDANIPDSISVSSKHDAPVRGKSVSSVDVVNNEPVSEIKESYSCNVSGE